MAKEKLNLNELKQTHGALNSPSTIDELTGRGSSYSVGSIEEYHDLLAMMTDDEMQQHAVDVAGIVPVGIRSLLITRLEDKFAEVIGARRIPSSQPSKMSKKHQEFQRKFFEQSTQ